MGELTLFTDYCPDTTALSNIFIDDYMVENNESQIKIYLYLLRNVAAKNPVTVARIADFFNYSIMDVERALRFMQDQKLIKLLESENKDIEGLSFLPLEAKKKVAALSKEQPCNKDEEKKVITLPEKPVYSKEHIKKLRSDEAFTELVFVAEAYLGKPITSEDVSSLIYLYDTLKLDSDFIDYLLEYACEQGKKNLRYVETVAKEMVNRGIKSSAELSNDKVEKKDYVKLVSSYFGLREFPKKVTVTEEKLINKWFSEFGFSEDIIKTACRKTLDATDQASIKYCDAILTNYSKNGVKSLKDIEALDNKFEAGKTAKFKNSNNAKPLKKVVNENSNNYDFAALEKEFLKGV